MLTHCPQNNDFKESATSAVLFKPWAKNSCFETYCLDQKLRFLLPIFVIQVFNEVTRRFDSKREREDWPWSNKQSLLPLPFRRWQETNLAGNSLPFLLRVLEQKETYFSKTEIIGSGHRAFHLFPSRTLCLTSLFVENGGCSISHVELITSLMHCVTKPGQGGR